MLSEEELTILMYELMVEVSHNYRRIIHAHADLIDQVENRNINGMIAKIKKQSEVLLPFIETIKELEDSINSMEPKYKQITKLMRH